MSAGVVYAVQSTIIGAAVIAATCAVAWGIGGRMAKIFGVSSPDPGDRGTGCIVAAVIAFAVAVAGIIAYGVGSTILDALR